jgi:hypothetical protein
MIIIFKLQYSENQDFNIKAVTLVKNLQNIWNYSKIQNEHLSTWVEHIFKFLGLASVLYH